MKGNRIVRREEKGGGRAATGRKDQSRSRVSRASADGEGGFWLRRSWGQGVLFGGREGSRIQDYMGMAVKVVVVVVVVLAAWGPHLRPAARCERRAHSSGRAGTLEARRGRAPVYLWNPVGSCTGKSGPTAVVPVLAVRHPVGTVREDSHRALLF